MKVLVGVSIILVSGSSFLFGGGDVGEKRVVPSLNKQRASNAFYQSIYFQKLSASRFLPLFNVTGLGSWESPRTIVTLDGIPYNGYPFGMNSIDLVPVDLVTVDTIIANTGTGIMQTATVSGGAINIVRNPIPESLTVDTRLFTGSETGDPLIHIFTRPERAHINKNKVGPSFALSLSNTRGNWSYRISGGGFFYFSTGSVNDYTMSEYNSALFGRQNRQVKVIGEAIYTIDDGRAIDIYAAGINLFGWEMSSFTSLFNHYTNVSTTGRIRYSDTSAGYEVSLVRDESLVWTKKMAGALPGSLRKTEWTLYPVYDIPVIETIDISTFANIGLVTVRDLTNDDQQKQSILVKDINSVKWGGGVRFGYMGSVLFSSAGVRVDSHFEDAPEISGELSLGYRPHRNGMLQAAVSSVAYFPGYLERYGIFTTTIASGDPDMNNEFVMSGNPSLGSERVHEIKLGYTQTVNGPTIRAEAFGRWTENRIVQHVERTFRPAETGEILRTTRYINNDSRFVPGFTVQLKFNLLPFLNISSDHQYIDNSGMRSLPRYKNINTLDIHLPLDVMLDISVMHTGKTVWEEFTLTPEDDAFLGEGSDGVIQSATVLDISVSRRFEKFYFAKGLEVSVQAQNFLNERYRRIPVGNFIDRAVFVYVSFGL